ncbi:S8 family serine peptidase [Pontibacter sp. G13]|uniref:S8 family serine peptidase n=1 Tax=Pontibacter sp. G13 TaxID=3074898 RepID=UPI0028899F93|nr:S8 family serine peptidase [Pontibacter sp. G13]WNJ16952.1 S8 family serine peptidase [Pontibacter sp. G13]
MMLSHWMRGFLLLGFCFVTSILSAQIEVNVRIQPHQVALTRALAQHTGPSFSRASIPQALTTSAPYLHDLRQVQGFAVASAANRSSQVWQRTFTLTFAGGNASNVIGQLQASGDFEWVELNHTYTLDAAQYIPSDDSISRQWYHPFIQTFEAWDQTRGNSSVKIGVIDTGIDYLHPEFQGQLAINSAEDLNQNGTFEPWPFDEWRDGIPGDLDGMDQDGNGYSDDVIGYDFVDQPRSPVGEDYLNEDPDPFDDQNHGTMVSGVIGAKMDNGWGGAGIAPNCELVTLRAFGPNGSGEDDDIVKAILYASDQGVDILNFSFGDVYASQMMHDAIQYAASKGVIMVGSAGNGTGDNLHYPSGYSEVISVSASSADLSLGQEFLWPLSSYGITVDLCAPGADILTTVPLDTNEVGEIQRFTRTQGTSFSAPMVSAAIALYFSEYGRRTTEQMRTILAASADDIGSEGWDHFTGAGRLNIFKMLGTRGAGQVEIIQPSHDGGSAEDQIWIVGTVMDPQFDNFSIAYQAGLEDTSEWITLLDQQDRQVFQDTLYAWDLMDLPDGDYTLRLAVMRTDGFTMEDRIRFVRDRTAPSFTRKDALPIWDNDRRKILIRFRSEDPGLTQLFFRPIGTNSYRQMSYERRSRNGEFLLDPASLQEGQYEFYLSQTNLSGLTGTSAMDTFEYAFDYISSEGLIEKEYVIPMGRYLTEPADMDGDGMLEIVMSEFDPSLNLGPLKVMEYRGAFFVTVDSIEWAKVLIPKDLQDLDGDGIMEMLASVNDSLYVLEAGQGSLFPNQIRYRNEGNERYASRFADTDADGEWELIVKDFVDHYILEKSGNGFANEIPLPDNTPGYLGSIAPRTLVGDFDADGNPEIIFGDFDGDVIAYEYRGGAYVEIFQDTSDLTKSGNYLSQGDFDGDGVEEWAVATHSSLLRNQDFEYDPTVWRLRIFEANGDDSYEMVWEDFLYDIDTEELNGASVGNLDDDPADEWLFSTFPRTYLLDHDGSEYRFRWFGYGSISPSHVIGDFDGNGVNEFTLGDGLMGRFLELDLPNQAPDPVLGLTAQVLGVDRVSLQWNAIPNATGYEIWRVKNPFSNDTALVRGPVSATELLDDDELVADTWYLYVLRSVNPALTPSTSGFGQAVLVRTHERPKLLSAKALSPKQVEVQFSQPMISRLSDQPYFLVDGQIIPSTILQTGDASERLVLAFAADLDTGFHTLTVDTMLLDRDQAAIDPLYTSVPFHVRTDPDSLLFLTHWEITGVQSADLYLSERLDPISALDPSRYYVQPFGQVTDVEWVDETESAVNLTFSGVQLGSLGNPISVELQEVCGISGVCTSESGNVAIFSSHQADLSSVYVYPNPVRANEFVDGARFANLTQEATVEIYSASGRFVARISEQDGDGGVRWNLRDSGNQRVAPGVYWYKVSSPEDGIEPFVGKFSVVE